ncbi:hypothetical protein TNCV_3569641 [Trichonephila clavipes]|nr:hypothetical protein TNCV_3569641 [Trichonephila clavipes]
MGSPHTNTIVITAEIESGLVTKDNLVPFRCSPVSFCAAPHQTEVSMVGRTILLERRQTKSVGRWDSRPSFLRSDWPRPFARRKVGVEMDWVDPKINDPRQGDLE